MCNLSPETSPSLSLESASPDFASLSSESSHGDSTESSKRAVHRSIFCRNVDLSEIFSQNVLAKILQVAEEGLKSQGALPAYPESVPQSGEAKGRYEYREAEFWTCGFFPGSIYSLLERARKFPAHLAVPEWYLKAVHRDLLLCGRHWSVALHDMSDRTDTHDMGFIIQPALRMDWELTGNSASLQSITKAAYALASRYEHKVGAIRSWDQAVNDRYRIIDMAENFLVIIDSMCNLDLLFYVGHLLQDTSLVTIATKHANTVRKTIIRDDLSTFHLVNLDPRNGEVKARMTNQGYDDDSTWSRGQAWAILGFAQTYTWTKDVVFLDTAVGCANAFLSRLVDAKRQHHHPFVPAWDFDAPQDNTAEPLRDTSAGVIAANGMLLIHQALQSLESSNGQPPRAPVPGAGMRDFLDAALRIVSETLDLSLDRDFASLAPISARKQDGSDTGLHSQIIPSAFDAILRNATANNNKDAHKKYCNHGLVYADYFLLEFGNKLCRMGFC